MAHILIVDGDVVSRSVIRTLLEESGHTVREANTGREALSRMDVRVPDLVLTELYLDGMEGIEFLREVRRRWPGGQVVVMASGSWIGLTHLVDITRHLGAAGFLQKPVDERQLGPMVEELLAS